MKNNKIIIYTDGSALGNPGPGGFGAVILFKSENKVIEIGEGETHTTNNRMELTAAIESLLAIKDHSGDVTVYTDSMYLMEGITKWVKNWLMRGWRTADKRPVLNQDLWQRLILVVAEREQLGKLEWRRVPGHAGFLGNERADQVATQFAEGRDVTFAHGTLEEYEKIFNGKLLL